MSRFLVSFVTSCVLAALPAAADSTSPRMCAGLPYVPNVYWTTDYGPAPADVLDGSTNMVPCTGKYALCYYSGASPMTCTVNPGGKTATCQCYALETSGSEVYYVDVNAILNTCVYIETVRDCGTDGSGCQTPNSAPVCQYIQDGTLYEKGPDLVSTYSTAEAKNHGGVTACTECASAQYAGCMTAPCALGKNDDGFAVAVCECPLATGPYQVGQDDVSCSLPAGQTWSAAYNVAGCASVGPGGP